METLKNFTLIIAGDKPEEMVKKYDSTLTVEPYVVYKVSDAKKIHEDFIKEYEMALSKKDSEILRNRLNYLKGIDDIEFYAYITDPYELDDNGNAISTANPNGKYYTCKLGKELSMPLINKMGYEVFSELKGNIDWGRIHLGSNDTYGKVWDMVMNDVKPVNDIEKGIYENMKNRKAYFEFFGDKETYIISNTAFWGYAFLSNETGWVELESTMSQLEWVKQFYDKFIEPLSDDTRISVYECTRLVGDEG